MAEGSKGAKRIRTESGVISGKRSKQPAVIITCSYNLFKVLKVIMSSQGEMYEKWKKKSKREIEIAGTPEIVDFTRSQPRPNFKHNAKVPSELKSAQDIKASRKKKEGQKLKNMNKAKRKSVLGNDAKKKAKKLGNVQIGTKAGQRKVKAVLRR